MAVVFKHVVIVFYAGPNVITLMAATYLKRIQSLPGLLKTRPHMSHLKAKVKRPVFQENRGQRIL